MRESIQRLKNSPGTVESLSIDECVVYPVDTMLGQ